MKLWIYGFFNREILEIRLLGLGFLVISALIMRIMPDDATPILVFVPLGAYMFLHNPYVRKRKEKRRK